MQGSNWQTPANLNHKIYIYNKPNLKPPNHIHVNQLLDDNQEPRTNDNQCQRISAFLNNELTLQLTIGSITVGKTMMK